MSWIYGYHLKWKVARDYAVEHKLIARAPWLVSLGVAKYVIRTTGVKAWVSWASDGRIIITFHRCNERHSIRSMRVLKEDIVKVALALQIECGPRWYAYSEFDRGDEVDSSDGERMNWDTPATIKSPYLPNELYHAGVYDSDEAEDDGGEDESSESDSESDGSESDAGTETLSDRTATMEV